MLTRQDWDLSAKLALELLDYLQKNVESEYSAWSSAAGKAFASKDESWQLWQGMESISIETKDEQHETYLTLIYGDTYGH